MRQWGHLGDHSRAGWNGRETGNWITIVVHRTVWFKFTQVLYNQLYSHYTVNATDPFCFRSTMELPSIWTLRLSSFRVLNCRWISAISAVCGGCWVSAVDSLRADWRSSSRYDDQEETKSSIYFHSRGTNRQVDDCSSSTRKWISRALGYPC